MMLLNQVTRAFTARKRRTSTLFRRPKTVSTLTIDNEVEKKQDDCIFSRKKNHAVDDGDDIVSTTSNSSTTIDLTPCSSTRCVITTTSSKSMKRPDSIDIIRIPPVPTLLKALPSDNAEDIKLCGIPSLRRSTSIPDDNDLDDTICSYDDDDDEFDFDCDDSRIFAPPPVPFVCVPQNFSHADALLQTTQDSNCNIHNNILFLNRPPTRLGDWDDHTLESNPDDDDELPDTGTNKGKRRATDVAAGTRTSSSITMKLLVDQRHKALRRHQARTVLSQNFLQLSSIASHNNNVIVNLRRRTLLATLSNDDGKQQPQPQHQPQQHLNQERQQQRQPRVVKWNMIR